jgi:REP element-mobilizing transposase RayT
MARAIPAWGIAPGTRREKHGRAEGPIHHAAMPQSLSFVAIHVIFSTKERCPCLGTDIRGDLHAYLSTVARNAGCECFRVGGVSDHVHLAMRLSRTLTIAKLIETLKTSSSKWLKSQTKTMGGFAWQRGYGCFSISPADVETLCEYIDRQEEHHRTRTFQEEFRAFLRKYGVAYDEAYVWD